MPKKLGKETLEAALKLLAEKLEFERAEPVSLVICGGSALIALGLVSRTTKDVDVLALMDAHGQLLPSQPLPEPVGRAVSAARWALTQDASEEFVLILKDMLKQLGHEDIAKQL